MSRAKKYKLGGIYAVTAGDHVGKNIVLIKESKKQLHFLDLPDMQNFDITRTCFNEGVEHNILDLIEIIPDNVYDVCKKQYEKNSNTRQ